MEKLKVGIIGMGFIGGSHVEAVKRTGIADMYAVTDTDFDLARMKAEQHGVATCCASVDEMLENDEIQVIHNCTPNNLHLSINEKIIRAGKHVFSEKPLAMSSAESAKLVALLGEDPDTVAGVNFNYRMNPLVQDMKNRVLAGEIGKPVLVHGSYLQDWLLYDTDYNWRVEAEIGGASRCVSDIGSHWMDTVQTVTGSKIVEVCANIMTTVPVRKKPSKPIETFSLNKSADYVERAIDTEDYASVMIKFDNGAAGVFQCSQVSAGRKCFLNIEINGDKASFYWNQEQADQMWKGNRDANNELIMRNPNLMTPEARQYSYLGAGHPEGWNDALKNNIAAFYKYIADGKRLGKDKPDFATFEESHYILRLTEAILQSGKQKSWVSLR